jgi:hypothetical protein
MERELDRARAMMAELRNLDRQNARNLDRIWRVSESVTTQWIGGRTIVGNGFSAAIASVLCVNLYEVPWFAHQNPEPHEFWLRFMEWSERAGLHWFELPAGDFSLLHDTLWVGLRPPTDTGPQVRSQDRAVVGYGHKTIWDTRDPRLVAREGTTQVHTYMIPTIANARVHRRWLEHKQMGDYRPQYRREFETLTVPRRIWTSWIPGEYQSPEEIKRKEKEEPGPERADG